MEAMKPMSFFLLFLSVYVGFGQEFRLEGEAEVFGLASSEETLPFWMFANSSTAVAPETHFSGTLHLKGMYTFGTATIEAGASVFYRDGVEEEAQRKELYVSFQNSWLQATLGAKERPIAVHGLSTTNKNMLWSHNARPLPGLMLEASQPIRISETFAIDWGIAHYSLNDERFVDNTRVHYKRLGLITTFNEHHKLRAQLQHFAQWGGSSPSAGDLPNDFEAFFDVFLAKKRSVLLGDDIYNNALGNHLGSFLLDYEVKTGIGVISVYHEHPFEDGSGTRWANFPDGVWGVFYQPENKKLVTAVLYEYVDTAKQSGQGVGSGFDNYFSNNLYRSGWTYERNIIGVPFILADPNLVLTDSNSPIVNNRVKLHHVGVTGHLKGVDWVLKTTYVTNLGTYRIPFSPAIRTTHNFVSATYATESYGRFTLVGGVDFSNTGDTVLGGGLGYSYTFK